MRFVNDTDAMIKRVFLTLIFSMNYGSMPSSKIQRAPSRKNSKYGPEKNHLHT